MDKNVHVFGNLLHILTIFDWKITNIHKLFVIHLSTTSIDEFTLSLSKIEQKWSKNG